MNRQRAFGALLFSFTLQMLFFYWMAEHRFVSGDEGFYIYAAKDVASGRIPYLDFFYPQSFLMPLIYGMWMTIFGESWMSARVLSCIFAAGAGSLIFLLLARKLRFMWCLWALVLYATSSFVFPWYVTAKTYAVSVFFLTTAFYLLERSKKPNKWETFFCGVFIGLAVDVRLFFAALIPIFLILIWLRTRNDGIRPTLMFLLGGAITAIPMAILYFASPEVFWFNNMEYHMLRSSKDFAAGLKNKKTILKTILGLRDTLKFHGVQYPLLIWLSFLCIAYRLISKKHLTAAGMILIGLFVVNLLPTPSYVQYFVTLTPFAVYTLCNAMSLEIRGKLVRVSLILLLFLFTCEYLRVVPLDIQKYTKSGIGVLGVRSPEKGKERKIVTMRAIGAMINSYVPPNTPVLTYWPGYLVDSHAIAWPGLENHFGHKVGDKLSIEQRRQMKILSRNEIAQLISQKEAKYLLLTAAQEHSRIKHSLSSYTLIHRKYGVSLWKLES